MMNGYLFVLTLLAALGCAMMAGVFFAFSAFVMKALARLPAKQGIGAMQAINVAAVTFAFMAALFGTAAACGASGGWGLFSWDGRLGPYPPGGRPLLPIRTILLPDAHPGPRHEALAALEPPRAGAESPWRG